MSENLENAIIGVLNEWINKVSEAYQDKLPASSLKDSVRPFTVKESDSIDAGLTLNDYWKYVESGRKPGSKFPPVDAIIEWIRKKSIVPRPSVLPSGKHVIPTENQLAYLVGRKISVDGIPAKPFLNQTVSSMKGDLINMLNEAIGEEITKELMIEFEL